MYARDIRTGQVVAHRAGEVFAMCSVFKAFTAAAVLAGRNRCTPLDRLVACPPADLLPDSPRTEEHAGTGMTVDDLCAAAVRYSDNTAGNLLLRQIGGPAGLTRFRRSLGDRVSRLDRWEPDPNTAVPGDPRDTTTPQALGRRLQRLALGDALPAADRARLVDWMKGNTTGDKRIRAGLPQGWTVADKTGTGSYAGAHDVGVARTTRNTPVVLVVLSSQETSDAPVDEALIADAACVVAGIPAPGE